MGIFLACSPARRTWSWPPTPPYHPDITPKRFGSEKPIAMLSAIPCTPCPYRGFPSKKLALKHFQKPSLPSQISQRVPNYTTREPTLLDEAPAICSANECI